MANITPALSRYVAESRYEDLPPQIVHEGVRAFVNWIGCAAGGSREDNVERVLGLLVESGGKPQATIVGRGERLDALDATFINSMSSGALVFNDTHYATVAHPTSPVAAALLALAETRAVCGRDFVHALVLGDEIQCRVGNILCTPPAECPVGWSMAGLVSGIGAAVAAAKVMRLDAACVATAIGLAANQSGGLREAHGTMASQFTPGHAARCGLMAALLAARGFTCAGTMLEGANGFGAAFSRRPNFDAAVAGLGREFEMAKLAYKPYPCGFVIHPVIDACLEIARQPAFDAGCVERVELKVNPLAVQLTDRPRPENRNQALVSLQHWAAAALVQRAAGIAQMDEIVVHDPRIVAMRQKIAVSCDEATGREAASACVVLQGGARLEAQIVNCRGSAGRPLTDGDLSDKTLGQLRTAFADAAAEHILTECWRIERYERVDALCPMLAASS